MDLKNKKNNRRYKKYKIKIKIINKWRKTNYKNIIFQKLSKGSWRK